MGEHGLTLAMEKTETIVLTQCRQHNNMTIVCGDFTINFHPSIKYLGLQIKMNYSKHDDLAAKKTMVAARQIDQLIPTIKSSKQTTRRLISSVVTLKLLYATPIQTVSMHQKDLSRMVCMQMAQEYRAVSNLALAAVASMPLTCLLVKERAESFVGLNRVEVRRRLVWSWQKKKDSADTGRQPLTHPADRAMAGEEPYRCQFSLVSSINGELLLYGVFAQIQTIRYRRLCIVWSYPGRCRG